jgi:2-keto-4-pentenoate hydratase/2-oxohepta-3-ene-1,7-dioic acid hydratase in catechol pathway
MRIARFEIPGPDGPEARVAVARDFDSDHWIDARAAYTLELRAQGASPDAARRLAAALIPGSLSSGLAAGDIFLDVLRRAAAHGSEHALIGEGARLLAPIDPVAYRDFMAFEQHFVNGVRRLNGPDAKPASVLYEMPVSYFGNAHAILGPEDVIPWPSYTEAMDYELELGIVIGRPGRNLTPETALDHVLGLTVFNDFSARDIQRREMTGGLGPSKGKHFGSAVGPQIVTPNALGEDLRMTARINGEQWSEGSTGALMWTIAELVSWASAGEPLVAGTLLGTGTVGSGCGLELGRTLRAGDVVELEIEGIGVLRNVLGPPTEVGWMPSARDAAAVNRG